MELLGLARGTSTATESSARQTFTAVHNQMAQYLGLGQTPSVWADLNGDGVVDVNDYTTVKKLLNTRLP